MLLGTSELSQSAACRRCPNFAPVFAGERIEVPPLETARAVEASAAAGPGASTEPASATVLGNANPMAAQAPLATVSAIALRRSINAMPNRRHPDTNLLGAEFLLDFKVRTPLGIGLPAANTGAYTEPDSKRWSRSRSHCSTPSARYMEQLLAQRLRSVFPTTLLISF